MINGSQTLMESTWQTSLQHLQTSGRSATLAHTDATGATFTNPENMSVAEAAAELESVFLNELFKAMRAGIPESGLVEKSMAEKMFIGMQDSHLAREWALRGGVGIGGLMEARLRPEPEKTPKA